MPRTPKNRNRRAEMRQRLAAIKISAPDLGTVTIEDMLVSASGDDPRIRDEVARGLEHLAELLSALPPALQDSLAAWIGDEIRKMVRAKYQQPDSEVTQ